MIKITAINTLEKLAAWIIFSLAILMVYSFLSVAWAGCDEAMPRPLDFSHVFDAIGAESHSTQTYYQLLCGPTPEHIVHGCGGFKTESGCLKAGRQTQGIGYWKCIKEEIQEHIEGLSD